MLNSFFNTVYGAFLEAGRNTEIRDRFYTIVGHTLRLRFAGEALVPRISPALEHLSTDPGPQVHATVCLWDSASTNVDAPPFPWEGDDIIAGWNNQEHNENFIPIVSFKERHIEGAYRTGMDNLLMMDGGQNLAVYWVPDARGIPYYENGTPMHAFIQWWARKSDLQLVHAGAVGTPEGGVLLAGKGGVGKSCTALACLETELEYAGDDYVLLGPGDGLNAYGIYNSIKLHAADIDRFPKLRFFVSNSDSLDEEKAVIFLHDALPDKVSTGFPIRAVLLPRVAPGARTGLRRVSPAAGLRGLAPSTIFQSRGAGQRDLKMMAEFTRRVPCYILELGGNDYQIPEIILDLLAKV